MNPSRWFMVLTALLASILLTSPLQLLPPIGSAEGQVLPTAARNWEYLNGAKDGGNYGAQNVITAENVHLLELKWMYPIPSVSQRGENLVGFGTAEGTMAPTLIVDGVLYSILQTRTVIALSAKTGELLWMTVNDADNDEMTARLPIRPAGAHTHGMHYIDGLLWFSNFHCSITALDPQTGEKVREITDTCLEIPLNDPRGIGIPTNSGIYNGRGPHPPSIYKTGNIIIDSLGGDFEGTWGGRHYVQGLDFNSGEVLWRTFLMPPCGDPTTCGPGLDGPLFVEEKAAWGQMLVDNCDKIWIQQIKACELDQDLLRNDWGPMRSNSGISNIWGQVAIDEETGIIYFGTAQPGPDWNATYSPGFRLFGSAVMALDGRNGDLVWAHQTTARDLWDYDCSWNTILTNTEVNGEDRKVVIKGCKNGIVYVLDAATGEAYHLFDPPSIKRTPDAELLDPRSRADMTKPHQYYPGEPVGWQNCPASGCLESDIAFDPVRNMVFFGTMNEPRWTPITPVENRGDLGIDLSPEVPYEVPNNYTINAYNVNTGELVWEFFSPGFGFRGGVMTSGGVVYPVATDNVYRALDAETGEVLAEKIEDSAVQSTIGADEDGEVKLIRTIGGRGRPGRGPSIPGAIMAYGLPDRLPAPQVVEVPVPGPERVVEVEVPVDVIREVEVPVEVIQEVPVQVISPVSYVAIGVGVVLVVIAGVLFTRRRSV